MSNVASFKGSRAYPAESDAVEASFTRTTFGGDDGNGGEHMGITREEIDAKLERTEAKVEKTLAEIRSDLFGIKAELSDFREKVRADVSHLPTKSFFVGTVVAIVGALLTALALSVTMFGNGIMVATASVDKAYQALEVSGRNAEQIKAVSEQMDLLLKELRSAPTGHPSSAAQ